MNGHTHQAIFTNYKLYIFYRTSSVHYEALERNTENLGKCKAHFLRGTF